MNNFWPSSGSAWHSEASPAPLVFRLPTQELLTEWGKIVFMISSLEDAHRSSWRYKTFGRKAKSIIPRVFCWLRGGNIVVYENKLILMIEWMLFDVVKTLADLWMCSSLDDHIALMMSLKKLNINYPPKMSECNFALMSWQSKLKSTNHHKCEHIIFIVPHTFSINIFSFSTEYSEQQIHVKFQLLLCRYILLETRTIWCSSIHT